MSQTDLFDDSEPLAAIAFDAYVAKDAGDDREWRRLAKRFGEYEMLVAITVAVRTAFAARQFNYRRQP